jgi:hypothetical protein
VRQTSPKTEPLTKSRNQKRCPKKNSFKNAARPPLFSRNFQAIFFCKWARLKTARPTCCCYPGSAFALI